MDFHCPSAKADFVVCFTLPFGSTCSERKTIKYFVQGFYKSFFPPVKRVRIFDISHFKAKPIFIPLLL